MSRLVDDHPTATAPTEADLRHRLGIPDDATEVVVVAESTHWDPNWLLTSRQYYRTCVRPTLDRVLDALVAEPRRTYSLECTFFVDLYWQDRPRRRSLLRRLVEEGRLRFTGCGVTTPDTLLPEDELLLRDLLVGQEWIRDRAMGQEPRLLYLPDSFGHSPGLPSLLAAAGLPYAAICRIDGMRFPGADMEPARNFPRPGTTAAQLLAAGSADFVWAGPDGSEVLTHWMAHGYGHGDMLASGGLSRALGLPASWPDRRPAHVDARIDGYLSDLRAVARTPYRLLAIGFDFVRPVPRLVELLDGWNDRHHGRTGTWLVNAAVDDYLDLVSHHRSSLPRLQLDPNPYWMGFYASRPDIKADARRLGRRLVAADGRRARWTLAGHDVPAPTRAHRAAWWTATTSNHHDFVTGTAPDRVARGEQARWLRQALDATADPTPDPVPAPPRDRPGPSLAVDRTDGRVVVTAPWGRATFAPERGGCLVGLRDADGVEHLSGPSLELHSYRESGGLWRMGHEINGGRWAPADRSSRHRATVEVTGDGHRIEVTATTTLDGRPATVVTTLTADDPTVVVRTAVTAPLRRTVTLALRQGHRPTAVAMHQPGGVVDRPLQRWYAPTFWPLHSFAGLVGPGHRDGPPGDLVVATASPTGIHVAPDGRVEVIVARTAVKEIAFGAVPVLAPAWGRAWGTQSAVIAAGWTPTEGRAAVVATGRALAGAADRAVGQDLPPGPVRSGDAQVEVISVKPADRGAGTIVRLRNWAPSSTPRPVPLRLDPDLGRVVTGAHLVDSRERDGDELPLTGGDLVVPVTRYLTSIRLVTGPGAAT